VGEVVGVEGSVDPGEVDRESVLGVEVGSGFGVGVLILKDWAETPWGEAIAYVAKGWDVASSPF
jgi:hypothetical protein